MTVKETSRVEVYVTESEVKAIVARYVENELGWESMRIDSSKWGLGGVGGSRSTTKRYEMTDDDTWVWQYVEIDGVSP